MTVKELIALLREYEPDQQVYIAFPSGDYLRRPVATPADDVEEANLTRSPYHEGINPHICTLVETDEDAEALAQDQRLAGCSDGGREPVVIFSGRTLK